MEQEIRTAPGNLEGILTYYFRPRGAGDPGNVFERRKDLCSGIQNRFEAISEIGDRDRVLREFTAFSTSPEMKEILSRLGAAGRERLASASGAFTSDERVLLSDILRHDPALRQSLALIDAILVWKRRRTLTGKLDRFIEEVKSTGSSGGRVYLVASGTSYHAALVAAVFFNDIARIPVYPVNPGAFRGMYMDTLGKKDLVIGISQSGETKDLVDIFTDIRGLSPDIRLFSIVNNENSRIPQELSDLYLPILCGPEIAVAATKSFINQLVILLMIAARLVKGEEETEGDVRHIQALLAEALEKSGPAVASAADRLFQAPSMHILAATHYGLAREGALKIREVVLNHTEGYDVAEFKHGPNTILGMNTLFSFAQLEAVYREAVSGPQADTAFPASFASALAGLDPETLFPGYPLVFLCPPDERDMRITISQIHTHKIRGADIILIAEPDEELRKSISGRPANRPGYFHHRIDVPVSGSRSLFVFPAAAILQLLAFEMSVRKMEYLDRLGIADHGVHPDTPKNVSKSITVD
jgi:glucosamine 6-phosphate synthetase-like amidotransferase/phosphosugar isomerase protein